LFPEKIGQILTEDSGAVLFLGGKPREIVFKVGSVRQQGVRGKPFFRRQITAKLI